MLNESNTIKTIFTMFTLPRGYEKVLSDLKSSDALTNTAVPLRYGWAGERGPSTGFSDIFAHLAFSIRW